MKALLENGVDAKKRIIGVDAPHPVLFNLPLEFIERFRSQIKMVDVRFEGDPEVIRSAVWSCYQEEPVPFRSYSLFDPGAYPEQPLSGRITWRVTQPWSEPQDEAERKALEKVRSMVELLRRRSGKEQ